jgi:hypothetical protein
MNFSISGGAFRLLIAGVSAGLICGCKDEPKAPVSTPAAAVTPATAETMAASALTATADGLVGEFKASFDAAKKKYVGKSVEVTGPVLGFRAMDKSGPYTCCVILGQKLPDNVVYCWTKDSEPWLKVSPGQTIKVRGTVPVDVTREPLMMECEFIDPPAPQHLTITTEELAGEHDKDPVAFEAKYKGKPLLVSGEVVKKDYSDRLLKGTSATLVLPIVEPIDRWMPDMLSDTEVGTKLKLYSTGIKFPLAKKNQIQLTGCKIVRE